MWLGVQLGSALGGGEAPVSWCGNKNGESGARCGQGCDGVKTAPPGREETSVSVKSWLTGGVKMLAESTGFSMLQDKSRAGNTSKSKDGLRILRGLLFLLYFV